MGYVVRRYYMEKNLADKVVTIPKQAKSLMWYVGYLIAAGVIGVTAMLFLMEVV